MILLAGSLSMGNALAEGSKAALKSATEAQQRTVSGKVVDAQGNPIPGASVMIAGTNRGAVTATDGSFSLAVPDGAELEVSFLGYVTVTAVEAGYNRNHNVKSCVGYLLTLSDGVKVYVSGDTSKTKQMPELSALHIDYAFFCCDGVYNMDLKEAAQCARLVGARHDIPYHVIPASGDKFFDRERAGQFDSPNLLVVEPGEEILLQNSEA